MHHRILQKDQNVVVVELGQERERSQNRQRDHWCVKVEMEGERLQEQNQNQRDHYCVKVEQQTVLELQKKNKIIVRMFQLNYNCGNIYYSVILCMLKS